MAEGDARASWVVLLVLCGVPGLHNAMQIGPVSSLPNNSGPSAPARPLDWLTRGGQLAASFGGPLYGALLDRGLGFGAVWGTTTALGLLRVLAVLGLREPARR